MSYLFYDIDYDMLYEARDLNAFENISVLYDGCDNVLGWIYVDTKTSIIFDSNKVGTLFLIGMV